MILNTPILNQKYRWSNSDVIVRDIRSEQIAERHHSDGSYSPARTRYSVQIEDVTEGGKFQGDIIWTCWTTAGFLLIF